MIEILIHPDLADKVAREKIEPIVHAVLVSETVPAELSVTVVITTDDEVRALNSQFRGIDAPTDVLSFGDDGPETGFVDASDDPPYLGDVIVSLARAQEQAAEQGHGVWQEVRLLVVHGILHLLGYDHGTAFEQARMWDRQDAILRTLSE